MPSYTSHRFAGALLASLLLSVPARAQAPVATPQSDPAAFLPDTTEVYAVDRVTPEAAVTRDLWRRFSENPVGQILNQVLDNQLKINIDRDLWSWFRGRGFVAWVRTADRSPIDLWVERVNLNNKYDDLDSALESLYYAANSYHEQHKKWPAKIEEVAPGSGIDLDKFPGVTFSIRITPGSGTGAARIPAKGELLAEYDSTNPLAAYAEPPRYVLGKEARLVKGKVAPPPALGLVIGLESSSSSDAARLVDMLARAHIGLDPDPAHGGWSFEAGDLHWSVVQKGDWLLLSDQSSLIDRFGVPGAAGSLAQSARYRFQQAKLATPLPPLASETISGFVDITDIYDHVKAAAALGIPTPVESFALRAWQLPSSSPAIPREAHGEAFLRLVTPPGGPVAQWLARPGGVTNTTTAMARSIPWETNQVYGVNLAEAGGFVQALAASNPMLQIGAMAGIAQLSKETGVNLTMADLTAGPGWLNFYSENSDSFGFGFRSVLEFADPSKGAPSPDAVARIFPACFTFDLANPTLQQQLVDKLNASMGGNTDDVSRGALRWKHTKDGALALATSPGRIYWAGGHTERLLVRELKTTLGEDPSLADLDTFKQFQAGIGNGRVLTFGHLKLDSIYSLLKGAVLSTGADFRNEATELGRLRDVYSVTLVQPDGLRMVSTLYASEQVPSLEKGAKR